ncbi:hypothetical protein N5J77_27775 [Sphingobium yanoikuyae]|uniref:DUF6950 domain-containing protein n=1 Tax=Sphingobium yanoikuyae TaxID=13690 RepID=A0AA42X2M3_SPHYA|nr:hypothetical protein [Sphingobium yanoikuyae]MDH2134936.1 hypothetical protein [Sphingobium yanoikuyae]MDH2152789.1 hypothetical protein [Sphingobium yanoikuyae]MDH2170257.1 hypothetical protein [Sphingobium yanoikuyae]
MEVSTISRAADWEDRLRTLIDRLRDEPFKWGQNDCALFASSAIKAMCGVDPAGALRGAYSDEKGAMEALRQHGAGTLLKTVRAWLGDPKPVAQAQRGDIVLLDRTTVGVCVGRFSWFVGEIFGHQGLTALPTADCKYAFSVPFEALATAEVAA